MEYLLSFVRHGKGYCVPGLGWEEGLRDPHLGGPPGGRGLKCCPRPPPTGERMICRWWAPSGEGREPGQDENSVFSRQSKDGALSAPHRLLTLCTKPLLKEKLLASVYRLRGAVSALASPSSENHSFQGPNT